MPAMKTAHVFDFDDTLSHSDAMIYAHPYFQGDPVEIHRIPGLEKTRHSRLEYLPNALRYSLTSREFADLSQAMDSHGVKSIQHGGDLIDGHVVALDFSDIVHVDHTSAKPIANGIRHLQDASQAGSDIWVLTGRKSGDESGIASFILQHAGVKVPIARIICVGGWGDSTHRSKGKAFINGGIPAHVYDEIYFYDDDIRNLDEVKRVVTPITKITVINSITGDESSDAKDRVNRARELRKQGQSIRRIRKLSGNN